MSKKYEQLAKDIIEHLGGTDNITEARHCQTRLRFKVLDENKVNPEKIESLDGVTKYLKNAGVHQIVIGPHVKEVFDEVEPYVDNVSSGNDSKENKESVLNRIIDFVSASFQPVIPALSGAGMVKAVLALLIVFKVITPDSQTYVMLNMFADSIFYFLPILLAFTVAQKLKCNPILAASVAAMMLHPTWIAAVASGEKILFFDAIPFTLANYAGSVIPIILVIICQSFIEKWLTKAIPKSVELVFVPMLTFLIMGTLAFSVIGPLGNIVGGYLATFFTYLSENASWVPAVLIGGFLPLMVMFGLHNGVAPLGVMQMAELGYDSIFGPGCLVSNMAQATASAVVAFRTKDQKLKQVATSGAITAYMGITEPTLYGVNLPKRYPLIASMIAGASGGLYAGLTHTHRFATGSSGFPAVLLYIGDDTMIYFYNILIAMVIAIVVSGVLTYVLSFKYETNEKVAQKDVEIRNDLETMSIDNVQLMSPIPGKIIELSEVEDEAFSSESLGKGFAIEPSEGKVYAPFDGEIVAIFPTRHAIGLRSKSGVEVLIHIGLDTVNLNGQYFELVANNEAIVQRGELLLTFDIDKIQQAGYSTQVPVVITKNIE